MSDKDKDDLEEEEEDTTSKDIKKGMDKYEAKIRSGEESPAGDSTRSEE
ncbi:MAG: hypothetical protein M3129_02150 [Thermoproteota archaeon]|nr:hypothetical protein [Thermoproteota archaeon]